MPDRPFEPQPDEIILYRSQASHARLALVRRLIVGILIVALCVFFSFTAFNGLAQATLEQFLPPAAAIVLSQVLCMGLVPLLALLWFAEDTLQAFSSELVLTDRRIWIRRSPYLWSPECEIPRSDIRSIHYRRDGLFITRYSSRKPQVHMFPDGQAIAQIYEENLKKSA